MNMWAQSLEESIKELKNKVGNTDNAVKISDLSAISIDTQKLAFTFRNSLKDAQISQETFATEVLRIPFTSLQRHLYQPKPWTLCSDKWKQQYLKMYEWVQLPESLEELNELMNSKYNDIDTIQ
jgi:hypothetical protein